MLFPYRLPHCSVSTTDFLACTLPPSFRQYLSANIFLWLNVGKSKDANMAAITMMLVGSPLFYPTSIPQIGIPQHHLTIWLDYKNKFGLITTFHLA